MTREVKRDGTRPGMNCCGVEAATEEPEDLSERMTRMAAVFKALSDETRLRILRSLMRCDRPLCECELVPSSGLSQSTISYHLKVLREAGLIEVERRGVWGYYRANPRGLLGLMRDLAEMA